MTKAAAVEAKKQHSSETPLLSGLLPHAAVRPGLGQTDLPPGLSTVETPGFGRDFSQVPVKLPPGPAQQTPTSACPLAPRRCPFGGACHACPARVQAKLKVGQPDDAYEREAGRVADLVMRMPEPVVSQPDSDLRIQRACPKCDDELSRQPEKEKEEEEQGLIQTKLADGAQLQSQEAGFSAAPPLVQDALNSPGQPLDPATRAFMEPRFGHNFSRVRVHLDDKAAESARAVGAGAYTVGHQIVFDTSRYTLNNIEGKQLLAHELTHVIQQSSAASSSTLRPLGEPNNPFEVEAEYVSKNVMQNQPANVQLVTPIVAPQFGLIGCMWYLWRYSRYIDECRREYKEAGCEVDDLSDQCQEFMAGAQWPSDAILKCVGRKNPQAMAKLLSSCSTVSLGRILKGPRASLEEPSETSPEDNEEQTTEAVAYEEPSETSPEDNEEQTTEAMV